MSRKAYCPDKGQYIDVIKNAQINNFLICRKTLEGKEFSNIYEVV